MIGISVGVSIGSGGVSAPDPYGPELVNNAITGDATTGYEAIGGSGIAMVGSELEVTVVGGGWYARQDITTEVGATYRIRGTARADAANVTAQSARVVATPADVPAQIVSANGTPLDIDTTFVASDATLQLSFGVASGGAIGAGGDKAYFTGISIKKVL